MKTTLFGRLTGSDDRPLRRAVVILEPPSLRGSRTQPLATVPVKRSGTFRIELDRSGFIVLRFAGEGHPSKRALFYIGSEAGESIEIEARLSPPERLTVRPDVSCERLTEIAREVDRVIEAVAAEHIGVMAQAVLFRTNQLLEDKAKELSARASEERDPMVRDMFLLGASDLLAGVGASASMRALWPGILDVLQPESVTWTLDPHLAARVAVAAGDRGERYFDRVLLAQKDRSRAALMLKDAIHEARFAGQSDHAHRWFVRYLKEFAAYDSSENVERLEREFDSFLGKVVRAVRR